MKPQRSTLERAAVFRWHTKHGRNVSETCRHFGISRATFYRWQARYDPTAPAKSLKAHSRRPDTVRVPKWTDRHLARVADLSARFPAYGRRRLHAVLAQDCFPFSESTVGRLLAIVRRQCPICGGRAGQHDVANHYFWQDLGQVAPQLARLRGGGTKLERVRKVQHQKRRRRAKKAAPNIPSHRSP